jgi:ERO1-like protein alpha
LLDLCLEKRIFYRLISGLHTSINIHLSAKYLHKDGGFDQPEYWALNPKEFKRRFHPDTTNGQGPKWLKNLYFIFLVELRALSKAAPYLANETFYAGRSEIEDKDTKHAILKLLDIIK